MRFVELSSVWSGSVPLSSVLLGQTSLVVFSSVAFGCVLADVLSSVALGFIMFGSVQLCYGR